MTGGYHFEATSLWEAINKIAHDPSPPLHAKRPDVPRDLSNVVAKAMAYDPEDRPSARELARKLVKVLEAHDLRLPPAPPNQDA